MVMSTELEVSWYKVEDGATHLVSELSRVKNNPETKSNLPHLIDPAHFDGLQSPAKHGF